MIVCVLDVIFCIRVMLVMYLCDLCILLMLPSIEQKTYIVNLFINLSIQNFEGGLRILYFCMWS